MKRLTDQKFLLLIVVFLISSSFNSVAFAWGRSCSDLFLGDLLFPGEARRAALSQRVDEASFIAAAVLAESAGSRVENPGEFVRFVQAHIVKTFEVNIQILFDSRRDLYDFLVSSNSSNSKITPADLGELLTTTSKISSMKAEGHEIFQVTSQDRIVFLEAVNRLSQKRRALH